MSIWVIVVLAVVAPAGAFVVSRSRRYGQMFSEEHFREFHQAMLRALDAAAQAGDQPPTEENRKAFVTSAGLAVCVTRGQGDRVVHVSLSQQHAVTTHAVCSRFGFFVLAMFAKDQPAVDPFFTHTGVHHLVLQFPSSAFGVQDFDTANAAYRRDYQPISFRPPAGGTPP